MKVAIVHDFFCNLGGSDTVAQILHQLFPEAPVYTLVIYDRNRDAELVQGMDIRTSFIQNLPLAGRTHQPFLPLFPIAIEQFDLSGYDLVISSSHSFAKGVITSPQTLHICYCHTPMRYAWDLYGGYTRRMGQLSRALTALVMNYIRLWDVLTAERVDCFIANSQFVAKRIKKYYGREARVIHPPVDTSYYTPMNEDEDYYLVVSRLTAYKRIDLAVKAFNKLGLPLRIIGTGPEMGRLRAIAKTNIQLLGEQPREVLREHLAKCRAFVFPGKEDFGIAPLEAQAAGRPVIAYAAGGALETVVEGVTGIFFHEQTIESLIAAVERLDAIQFDKDRIRQHALRFDEELFKQRIVEFIQVKYAEHQRRQLDA